MNGLLNCAKLLAASTWTVDSFQQLQLHEDESAVFSKTDRASSYVVGKFEFYIRNLRHGSNRSTTHKGNFLECVSMQRFQVIDVEHAWCSHVNGVCLFCWAICPCGTGKFARQNLLSQTLQANLAGEIFPAFSQQAEQNLKFDCNGSIEPIRTAYIKHAANQVRANWSATAWQTATFCLRIFVTNPNNPRRGSS